MDNHDAGRRYVSGTEIPAEIADARDMAATALSNLEGAEASSAAALAEFRAASAKLDATDNALALAAKAEADARAAYVDTLRRHGYVQTADGPRPAAVPAAAGPAIPPRDYSGNGPCA